MYARLFGGIALAASLPAWGMVIDPVDPLYGVAIVAPVSVDAQLAAMTIGSDGRVALIYLSGTGCRAPTIVVLTSDGQLERSLTATDAGIASCLRDDTVAIAFARDGAIMITATPASESQRLWKVSGSAPFSAPLPAGVDSLWRPALQVLANDSIAVGGTAIAITEAGQRSAALAVARLRADGTIDDAYGTHGLARAVPPNRPIFDGPGGGMVVAPGGDAYVAGNIFEDDAGAKIYTDATVARFDAQGHLDTNFGDAGFAIPLRDASTYARSLAVVEGEAYLAGVQGRDVKFAFLARVKSNGQIDLTFGNAGIVGIDRFAETNFEPRVGIDAAHRVYFVTSDTRGHVRVTRYRADGAIDTDFGLAGTAYVAAQDYGFANATVLVLSASGTPYIAAGAMFDNQDPNKAALGVTRLRENGGHRNDVTAATAAIYYNAHLDHFFLTANPAEQALLDNGTTPGWSRTGDEFRVVTSSPPGNELAPVCRYYGRPEAHLDSHFFSAARDECDAVAQKFAASWLLETADAFEVHLADRASGACPRGSERIFRAFDNRADANHYYGTSPRAPAGWIYEGYGSSALPTAFCAPLL